MRAFIAAVLAFSAVPALAQDHLPNVQSLSQSMLTAASPFGPSSQGVTATALHNSVTKTKTIANGSAGYSDSNVQSNGAALVLGQGGGVSGLAVFGGGGVASGTFSSTTSTSGSTAKTSSSSTNGSHSVATANR